MKKYNTPEMKVSMFDNESVVTVSDTLATYNYYAENTADQEFVKSWNDLSITF